MKIYYNITNAGDGSAYLSLFETKGELEEQIQYEEEVGENFAEDSSGFIEVDFKNRILNVDNEKFECGKD